MRNPSSYFWWRVLFDFSWEVEESLCWYLDKVGIKSYAITIPPLDSSQRSLIIWLPSHEWHESEINTLNNSLSNLTKPFFVSIHQRHLDKVEDEEWSTSWKKYWFPDQIGSKLIILPAWLDKPIDINNRFIIRIDPGCAFGTGSHPTTRLCLEILEKIDLKGFKVADIGCGSGILSLASLYFGADNTFAVDNDSLAIASAKQNANLNNSISDRLHVFFGSVEILQRKASSGKFDLILCNILLNIIIELVPMIDNIVKPGGQALFSGILVNQSSNIVSILEGIGWEILSLYSKDEWSLIHARKII